MGTQFSMMVFALLWGVPYLESAQHLSASAAGALMTLFVLGMICIGPVVGMFTSRHPARRSWLLLSVIAADALIWTAVLAVPGPAPHWLLVLLVVVLSAADQVLWSGSTSRGPPTPVVTSAWRRAWSTWPAFLPRCSCSPRWAAS